jgi:hypothetical protein
MFIFLGLEIKVFGFCAFFQLEIEKLLKKKGKEIGLLRFLFFQDFFF